MANLIAQEQHASDNDQDGFMEAPHQCAKKKQLPGPISAASSIADDNFFSNLPVEGLLEEANGDYVVTELDSESGSQSDGDDITEITNEEVPIIFTHHCPY